MNRMCAKMGAVSVGSTLYLRSKQRTPQASLKIYGSNFPPAHIRQTCSIFYINTAQDYSVQYIKTRHKLFLYI
jgi:hypothetical protein